MPYADVRDAPLPQNVVEPSLVREVKGRGALVEKNEGWRREEHARKREALLFAEGKPRGPVGDHIEWRAVVRGRAAVHHVFQAHLHGYARVCSDCVCLLHMLTVATCGDARSWNISPPTCICTCVFCLCVSGIHVKCGDARWRNINVRLITPVRGGSIRYYAA